MPSSYALNCRIPKDVHLWLVENFPKRGCASKTDYVLQLLAKGIQAEAIDDTVARIQEASQSGPALEMLRQTLAIRFMIEQQARGKLTMTERIGTDALVWADKEITRLFPERSES